MSSPVSALKLENVLYEKKRAIAYVTFNRPKVLNALNQAVFVELKATFEDARDDADVRGVDGQLDFGVETLGAVVEVGRADSQDLVIDDHHLGVADDRPAARRQRRQDVQPPEDVSRRGPAFREKRSPHGALPTRPSHQA